MRPRTPALLWLPFVFSIGAISWALLIVGTALLAAVILAPAVGEAKSAEAQRNEYQATLDLLDQQIALEKDFAKDATKDPVLMERLASRQLNVNRPDQEVLLSDPTGPRDRSVQSLLAQSLHPVTPAAVKPMNPMLELATGKSLRPLLIIIACCALTLSFFLGVKYERH